jgi:hypothetical protein
MSVIDNSPHWSYVGDVAPLVVGEVTPVVEDAVVPPLPAVVVVAGAPPEAAIIAFFNGVNQAFAGFASPELLGCTPSTVSVASS